MSSTQGAALVALAFPANARARQQMPGDDPFVWSGRSGQLESCLHAIDCKMMTRCVCSGTTRIVMTWSRLCSK